MQVGDLVRDESRYSDHLGIIVAKVNEPRATGNDVCKVVWTDGDVTDKVWDYDLTKVET